MPICLLVLCSAMHKMQFLLNGGKQSCTQVKIDGSKRARYGPRTRYNGPVKIIKNNGTVTGFQAVKCRYIEGSKNGPVWTRARNGPVGPRELLPV